MNIIFFLGENDIHYESDWSVENYEWQCLHPIISRREG